ncbi:MAG: hypothetical protein COC06_12265 [Bacteroidales bacterium]|nr:MAG: hypothetical protein COC06_12265 [Bacteroidales bacterium]
MSFKDFVSEKIIEKVNNPALISAIIITPLIMAFFALHKTLPINTFTIILIVLISIDLLLILSGLVLEIKKYSNKSKYISDAKSNIKVLNTMESVRDELISSFENSNHGTIAQTFVGANTISSLRDYAKYIKEQKEPIRIERYFYITSPEEINFAAYNPKKNKKLGANLSIDSYFWHDKNTKLLHSIFANLTIFPGKTIITFSNKNNSNAGIQDKKELFKSSDSKDVIGVALNSDDVSQTLLKEYIYKLPRLSNPTDINEIKKEFFLNNPYEYISSIAYSISKEISSLDEFNPILKGTKINYAGIVGSFLKKKNVPSLILDTDFIEVDLLIFIPTEKIEVIKHIFKIASEVTERYTINKFLEVRLFEKITPMKNSKCYKAEKVVDIQLIINDSEFTYSKQPSPLVVYHRNNNNLPFPIYKNEFSSLKETYPETNIDKYKLLDSPLGIKDLKESINSGKLAVRYWDYSSLKMEEEWTQLDTIELRQFCMYAIKWSIINYLIHILHHDETSHKITELLEEIKEEFNLIQSDIKKIVSGDKKRCIELLSTIENKLMN